MNSEFSWMVFLSTLLVGAGGYVLTNMFVQSSFISLIGVFTAFFLLKMAAILVLAIVAREFMEDHIIEVLGGIVLVVLGEVVYLSKMMRQEELEKVKA